METARGIIRLARFYGFELFASARPRVTEHYEELHNIERIWGDVKGKRILDLGCGRFRSLSTFLADRGAVTIGIDLNYMCAPETPIWKRAASSLKAGGPKELVKDLGMALVKEPQYSREIRRTLERQPNGKIHLVRCDARQLPLPDKSLDAIVSYHVLEHITDIDAVARETARVLKPEGRTRHVIDIFSGLLGGHDPYWALQPKVRPWDHLRGGDQTIIRETGLNCLRIQDYVDGFSQWLSVESWTVPYAPARYHLTPEIRQELANYSEEELLLRDLVIQGKKR